ncbi:MAG TPA: hemerythrin domain-containing protein [Myxococcales bacterium]
MSHDECRKMLELQHRQLRALIARVRETAFKALKSDYAASAELHVLVGVLRAEIEKHLMAEESLLGPILERVDAWGSVRLDLMRAEHAHQRAVLAVLRSERAGGLPAALFAPRVLGLLDDISADMDAEDKDLLDPRVLRDDVIQLDASDA